MKITPLIIGIIIGTISTYGSILLIVRLATKTLNSIDDNTIDSLSSKITGTFINTMYEEYIDVYIDVLNRTKTCFRSDYSCIFDSLTAILDNPHTTPEEVASFILSLNDVIQTITKK